MIKQRIQITDTLDCIIYNPKKTEERVCFLDYSNPKIVRMARNFNAKDFGELSSHLVIDEILKEQQFNGTENS